MAKIKLYEIEVDLEVCTVHPIKVLVAGASEKDATINATRRVSQTIDKYQLIIDYSFKNIVRHKCKNIKASKIVPRRKKAPLTEIQQDLVLRLLKGDRFQYNIEQDTWKCGHSYVYPRTVISMQRKGVIKCTPTTIKERAIQVALGIINRDEIQLVLDHTSPIVKKIKLTQKRKCI